MYYQANSKPRVGAILLAAGSGTRMGGENKMLRTICGKTVLMRSLEALIQCREIERFVVVVSETTSLEAQRCIDVLGINSICCIEYGGDSRTQSVFLGLNNSFLNDLDIIVIHDGARCLLNNDITMRCIDSAKKNGSGVAAIAATDTMIYVDDSGHMQSSLQREGIRHMQTPQVFRFDWLREAYQQAQKQSFDATDDAKLIHDIGNEICLVEGSVENLKITTAADLETAAFILEKREGKRYMKVGFGEDVHALILNGGPLILAGVAIPYKKGLKGHSDADVLAHAVTDALLGAMAWGDIGQWFPDTDSQYHGADSMMLLKEVVEKMQQYHQSIIHIDATIVAQKPKLSPYCQAMREQLARILMIDIEQISIKATTSEGLGFEGAGEGITVRSIATVEGVTVLKEIVRGDK